MMPSTHEAVKGWLLGDPKDRSPVRRSERGIFKRESPAPNEEQAFLLAAVVSSFPLNREQYELGIQFVEFVRLQNRGAKQHRLPDHLA
jgi:hypothetical protein